MASAAEVAAMRRAIALAREHAGRTNPNPVVGCVILDAAGRQIAAAAHERAGGPHAEAAALAAARDGARGSTVVVTLEPCRHTGRTGPCTRLLVEAGVARVVFAVRDPGAVEGGGAADLSAAGVEVEAGVLEQEAAEPVADWLVATGRRRPFVTWKFAATLDGRSAAADGSSRWITGPAARADVHRLRAASDAVVVGVGTVLADDPRLTVRDADPGRQPVRVVVDSRLRTPPDARLLGEDGTTLIATTAAAAADNRAALSDAGADIVEVGSADGRVDPGALLDTLHARGLRLLLLEGGPTLAGAFLTAGRVDRVVAYVAPALLGAGPAPVHDLGISTIADAIRLRLADVQKVGEDVRLTVAV